MDELDSLLRPDTTELRASLDPDASLDDVVARGRRRTLARRVATGAAASAVIAGFAVLAGAGEQPTAVDVISPEVPETQTHEDPGDDGSNSDPEDEGEPGESEDGSAPAGTTPIERRSSPTTTGGSTEQPPRDARVELDIAVATDARSYRPAEEITVLIEACNRSDRPAVEYFANTDAMFRLRIVTADDRTVALGMHPRQGPATQTWEPGECRDYTMTWDQTEGELDDEGGQAAWPGEYTAQVDWFSTAPPPDGIDPGLYDPEMPEREPSVSPVFTIEEEEQPSSDGLLGDT